MIRTVSFLNEGMLLFCMGRNFVEYVVLLSFSGKNIVNYTIFCSEIQYVLQEQKGKKIVPAAFVPGLEVRFPAIPRAEWGR